MSVEGGDRTCSLCGFGPLLMTADGDPKAEPRCRDAAACAARRRGNVVVAPYLLRRALDQQSPTALAHVRRLLEMAEARCA